MALLLKATGAVDTVRPANGRAFTLAELQAKYLGLAPNGAATEILLAAGGVPGDVVVGDVLLADGVEMGEGEP